MNNMGRDIRYALRQLLKSPGFTATAVLTLAFGIGATTAIFSIVEGVLLRPLPFADPQASSSLGDTLEGFGNDQSLRPRSEAAQYTRDTHSFSSMGAYQQTGYELSGTGDPAQINASRLNAGVFTALGVSPLMGRVFTQPGRRRKGPARCPQLSDLAQSLPRQPPGPGRQDSSRSQAVRSHRRDAARLRVPARSRPAESQRTLGAHQLLRQGELVQGAASWNFQMVGRLKPGVTPAQAEQEMQRASPRASCGPSRPQCRACALLPLSSDSTKAPLRRHAHWCVRLFLAVTVVLFIACANLAGLAAGSRDSPQARDRGPPRPRRLPAALWCARA